MKKELDNIYIFSTDQGEFFPPQKNSKRGLVVLKDVPHLECYWLDTEGPNLLVESIQSPPLLEDGTLILPTLQFRLPLPELACHKRSPAERILDKWKKAGKLNMEMQTNS